MNEVFATLLRVVRARLNMRRGGEEKEMRVPDAAIDELSDILNLSEAMVVQVPRRALALLLNWAREQGGCEANEETIEPFSIDLPLLVVLVNAIHDRCYGVSTLLDPETALDEVSDGGGIHEIAHSLIRLLPPRHIERVRRASPVTVLAE